MKNKRQEKILELISRENIDTQDLLLQKLREGGFDVTQATVSRDIKQLRLIKVSTGEGAYRYAPRDEGDPRQSAKYLNIMRETVTSVNSANNLIVIKTYTGMAQAACAAFDSMYSSQVLGSIAGDDTIFVAHESSEGAAKLANEVNRRIFDKKK